MPSAATRVSPPVPLPPIALTWAPEDMSPEPSAVLVGRSRHALVPSFAVFVLEGDIAESLTVVILSCPCVSRPKTTDHMRQTRSSSVETNGSPGWRLRRCHHQRSELLRHDIAGFPRSPSPVHRQPTANYVSLQACFRVWLPATSHPEGHGDCGARRRQLDAKRGSQPQRTDRWSPPTVGQARTTGVATSATLLYRHAPAAAHSTGHPIPPMSPSGSQTTPQHGRRRKARASNARPPPTFT